MPQEFNSKSIAAVNDWGRTAIWYQTRTIKPRARKSYFRQQWTSWKNLPQFEFKE